MGKQIIDIITNYQRIGLLPIPLKGKVPLVRWKELTTITDDNKQYWVNKGVNWGLRTGQLSPNLWLYVVDLDSKELLAGFYESNPNLVRAPLVSTGKGFHIYLCWKDVVKSRRFNKVDIKGDGGYVVAPPSIHESGKPYRWIVPLSGLPPHYNPAWLGLQLSEAQTEPQPIVLNSSVHSGNQNNGSVPSGVQQGQRHNTLVSYLGAMHKACFREGEALSKALIWNAKNKPPLSNSEIIATVRDCWERWDRT